MATHFESLDGLVRRDPELQFRTDERLGVVLHLRGELGPGDHDPRAAFEAFVRDHRDLFGDIRPADLVEVPTPPDPTGGRSLVLQQLHAGHRVIGGRVRVHLDPAGQLDTISNSLFPDLASVPREATVAGDRAVAILQEEAASRAAPSREPELVVLRQEGRPYLAWEVRLETDATQRGAWGEPTQWIGYVDATGGRLLKRFNNFQTAGPVVAHGTGVYSGPGELNAWFTDTTYQLRDTTRTATGGPEIRTDDEDGASPSEDPDGDWSTLAVVPRDANQGAEVDAHRYAGRVADYFKKVHGRDSFDGAGATFRTVAHVGTDWSNGGWDGSKVNLGDGSGVTPGDDYECSDDWLAHEWTHAYTEHTCGLQYYGESGALNESFSDVFAAFITGDWLVFEDAWLKPPAPAWRNMVDPTNGGHWNPADPVNSVLAGHQPSHYSVRYTGTWDNAGVHVNSGIINNLFYLLTESGVHALSGIHVRGIGQEAVEKMLWRCMTQNLVNKPDADFLQFREEMIAACLDLYPGDLFKLTQVKAAFNAVGIGPDLYVRDNLADTGVEPYPGAWLYASPDIINRTAPVANPATDLADLGNDALWQNVEFGQDNCIYVRVQNRGPMSGDATINVYFAKASTFPTPASWLHVGTLTEFGIAPGSLRVAGPLTFPQALIPSPGHYCMIAEVTSTLDPAPNRNMVTSVGTYLQFIRGSNNVAYRNMDVVNLVPGLSDFLDVVVRGIGRDVHGHDVVIDDSRFVPGTRIRIQVPAAIAEAARVRGLRRVEQVHDQVVFEPEPRLGPEPQPGRRPVMAFEGVSLIREFTLRVDYRFPDRLPEAGPDRRRRYELFVRQLRKGEEVGAMGVLALPRRQ